MSEEIELSPEVKLYIKEQLDIERDKSNKSYAIKLIETGFISMVTVIVITVIGVILKSIFIST